MSASEFTVDDKEEKVALLYSNRPCSKYIKRKLFPEKKTMANLDRFMKNKATSVTPQSYWKSFQ